jgi:hypothetical protein
MTRPHLIACVRSQVANNEDFSHPPADPSTDILAKVSGGVRPINPNAYSGQSTIGSISVTPDKQVALTTRTKPSKVIPAPGRAQHRRTRGRGRGAFAAMQRTLQLLLADAADSPAQRLLNTRERAGSAPRAERRCGRRGVRRTPDDRENQEDLGQPQLAVELLLPEAWGALIRDDLPSSSLPYRVYRQQCSAQIGALFAPAHVGA